MTRSRLNFILHDHIDNFGRVDAHLYRGAQPEGRDFADLKALGVKTIVNLTSDDADPHERTNQADNEQFVSVKNSLAAEIVKWKTGESAQPGRQKKHK